MRSGTATTTCCHTFVALILKFLIFSQTFIGISIIVYSAYMLTHCPPIPSDSSPSPAPAPLSFEYSYSYSYSLPPPWFIYAFMGLGILLSCISCIGHIAAEAFHGCCLCFYTILKIVLILLEVALVAFIVLDRRWEKDLPEDPTGGIDSIRKFIQDNVDLCKWVGITIIVIQVLCLLLAVVLRMMVSSQKKDDDVEEASGRWEPLLNPHSSQPSGSTSADGKSFHSDIWSSRMREKYGLGGSQSNQSA